MQITEAVRLILKNIKELSDEQLHTLEFAIWAESMDRFVETGRFDDGPESYDEIRGA